MTAAAEAASLAGRLGLGKLIYLYDQNGISLAGSTALTFSEDVVARFTAYGFWSNRLTMATMCRRLMQRCSVRARMRLAPL